MAVDVVVLAVSGFAEDPLSDFVAAQCGLLCSAVLITS